MRSMRPIGLRWPWPALATAGRWKRFALMLMILVAFWPMPGMAAAPIKIGVSLGLTGRFEPMAEALRKGFALWEADVNRAGGILGRPVRLIVDDDHGDPDRAVFIYKRLVNEEKVDFLLGPYSSLITLAVLPIAEQHEMPMLIAGAAADTLWEQGFRHAVGVYTPVSKFMIGFFELLVLNDLARLAIVHADDPFSEDLARSAEKWSRRFGLTVTGVQGFSKGLRDLAPLALKAKAKNPDALIVCGHMGEAVHMVEALQRIGWRPRALYASIGPAIEDFYDRCGPAAEHVFATSLWEPRANYPGANDFNRRFIETYGQVPGYHAGLAYAAGQVLAKAVVEAGTIDRRKVRDTLFSMDTMTIIGRFGVDRNGKQVRQHTFIIQWQQGRKELVWPDAIKTAEAIFP